MAYNVELVWAHLWESVTSLEVTHKSKGVAGPGMFMGGGLPEFVDLEMVVDGQTIDLTLGNYGLFGAAGVSTSKSCWPHSRTQSILGANDGNGWPAAALQEG